MAPESQGMVPRTWHQHSASTQVPKVPSVAISKEEHTVLGICGPFLAQADTDAWGLAVGLPFI